MAMIFRNLWNLRSNQEKFCISDGERFLRHCNPMRVKFSFQRLVSSRFKRNFAEILKRLRNMKIKKAKKGKEDFFLIEKFFWMNGPICCSKNWHSSYFVLLLISIVPCPENAATNSNACGAHLDGQFEIPTHPHAWLISEKEKTDANHHFF